MFGPADFPERSDQMILDIEKYCDRPIQCSCGHTHLCPIKKAVVKKNALETLPELLTDYQRIFLAADTNTWAVCGEKVKAVLGAKVLGCHVFARDGVLVPDEAAVDELEKAMPAETDFVVGIGSGVINDICKYVTWKKNMDYAIAATAPSMDGYASSGAAMIIGGMKVTYTTRPPRYIVADVDVVKNAPMDMIRAGYGDIIGKYSALNDWKLANLVNGEYFCQEIYDLVMDVTNGIRDSVNEITARQDEAIELLTKALILIGITLSLLGSTRPGSGSEHHLSHFFEIVGLLKHEPHFVHGTDVAYSTIVTAGMREEIVKVIEPEFCRESEEARLSAWRKIYGSIFDEVAQLQKDAGSYERDLTPVYREKWTQIRELLAACPTAEECRDMFRAVGFDLSAFEKQYGKEKIRNAMLYGKDLKNRYSVLWLYYELFSGRENGAC